MKVQFCPACGRLNLADFSFCPYCGTQARPKAVSGLEEAVAPSFTRLEHGGKSRILEEIEGLAVQLDLLESEMDLLLETARGPKGQGRGP